MKRKDDDDDDGTTRHGKGTDLVLTIFNKATKETITMDAADKGEQFILTMIKEKSEKMFMAKSCSSRLIVDHMLNFAQENREEYMIAFMIAMSTGMIDKEMFKHIKVHKMEIPMGPNGPIFPKGTHIPGLDEFGDDDFPDIPGLGGLGDKSKPPTFN